MVSLIGLEFIIRNSNLNFRKVAEKLGISPTTLADWVKGRRKIPIARLKQLAQLFEVNEDYFQKELSRVEELEVLKINVIRHSSTYIYEQKIVDELGDEYSVENEANDSEEEMRQLGQEQEWERVLETIRKLFQNDQERYLDFFKDLVRIIQDDNTRRLIFLLIGAVTPGFGTVSYVDKQDEKEVKFTKAFEELLLDSGYKGLRRLMYSCPEC